MGCASSRLKRVRRVREGEGSDLNCYDGLVMCSFKSVRPVDDWVIARLQTLARPSGSGRLTTAWRIGLRQRQHG